MEFARILLLDLSCDCLIYILIFDFISVLNVKLHGIFGTHNLELKNFDLYYIYI